VFHPDGRHALVVGELDDVLHVLRREDDRFVLVGGASTRSAVASGEALPTGENTAAAVRLSADGRTVLVTNRGDDTIAVFAFDAASSALALDSVVPAHGRTPRDLVLSPEGDRVLVACQDSDEVTVFAFDAETRELRHLATSPVPTPVCLAFV
jgi:6-phosphogluconolactonase